MGLVVVTPPSNEPMTLAEFKLAARVTNSAEDTLITTILIPGARRKYELDTRRQIVTAVYDYFRKDFPTSRSGEFSRIEIPRPPLASVASVKYIDADGAEQTFDAADYKLTSGKEPGQIYPAPTKQWPITQSTLVDERVTIRFTAGVAVADVDPTDKQAISMLALHWFENREAVVVDQRIAVQSVPLGYNALMLGRQIVEV